MSRVQDVIDQYGITRVAVPVPAEFHKHQLVLGYEIINGVVVVPGCLSAAATRAIKTEYERLYGKRTAASTALPPSVGKQGLGSDVDGTAPLSFPTPSRAAPRRGRSFLDWFHIAFAFCLAVTFAVAGFVADGPSKWAPWSMATALGFCTWELAFGVCRTGKY